MDCTKCTEKGCRLSHPCTDRSAEYIDRYHAEDTQSVTRAASALVDDGRAGTLTRLEEIAAYAKLKGYHTLGVAYCYGMEREAALLRAYLEREGFRMLMASCTVDGVPECEVNTALEGKSVSCNPLGQANVLNRSDAEFTILMGLCLGHDVLIQKNLKMDFTTWIVKDRVTRHRPMDGLPGYHTMEDLFLEEMEAGFQLISWDKLQEKLETQDWTKELTLIDLRSEEAFHSNGIKGSVQCLLKDLPTHYVELLPDQTKETILYCNGGIQSLYAVMYLTLKGYGKVRSLAGGYANYLEKTGQKS